MVKRLRVGVLISGSGTNLQAILDACESGRLTAEVVFVGSDTPQASGLERARRHSVPTFVVDYRELARSFRETLGTAGLPADFRLEEIRVKQGLMGKAAAPERVDAFLMSRSIAEAALLSAMAATPYDLIALAGFMRTLTPYFIDRVNTDRATWRLMNIHPALLPAFPGTDGYGDTWRYGCKVAGCTVHFVDYGEDTGPIIGQRAFPLRVEDTLETIRRRGLEQEWELYPECIQLFAEGRLRTERVVHELPGGRRFERSVVRIAPAA